MVTAEPVDGFDWSLRLFLKMQDLTSEMRSGEVRKQAMQQPLNMQQMAPSRSDGFRLSDAWSSHPTHAAETPLWAIKYNQEVEFIHHSHHF